MTLLPQALDTEQTGRVDVHELGTLIRSVGCCPSETELQEMVTQLEEEGQPGFIRLQTVMPYIIQCVEDRKYPSASTEQLLQAFQVSWCMEHAERNSSKTVVTWDAVFTNIKY